MGCKPQSSLGIDSLEAHGGSPVGAKFSKNIAYYGIESTLDVDNKMKKANLPDNKYLKYNVLKSGDQVRFLGSKGSNCVFGFVGNFSMPEYRYYLLDVDCSAAEKKLKEVKREFSCLEVRKASASSRKK